MLSLNWKSPTSNSRWKVLILQHFFVQALSLKGLKHTWAVTGSLFGEAGMDKAYSNRWRYNIHLKMSEVQIFAKLFLLPPATDSVSGGKYVS